MGLNCIKKEIKTNKLYFLKKPHILKHFTYKYQQIPRVTNNHKLCRYDINNTFAYWI